MKSFATASRTHRRDRWLRRLMVPMMLAGILLPAAPAGPAGAQGAPATPTRGAAAHPPTSQPAAAAQQQTGATKSFEDLSPEDLFAQPQYETIKPEWEKTFKPVPGVDIAIPAASYTSSGGQEGLQTADNFQGRPGTTLLWTQDDGYVEWTVNVPQSGLYEITLDYYPIPGQGGAVQREFYLDGQLPFREANRQLFERVWRDQSWPPKQDNQGNDVRPRQVEAPEWQSKTLEDADGHYDAPFQFALAQG